MVSSAVVWPLSLLRIQTPRRLRNPFRGGSRRRGRPARLSQGPQCAVSNKSPAWFVPEAEGQRFEARKERNRLHRLEEGFGAMTLLQMIIRDARAQVMNVVKADVARKPLQHFRQLVKGASFQRRLAVVPAGAALPMSVFELV